MREHKYRAWDIEAKDMFEVHGINWATGEILVEGEPGSGQFFWEDIECYELLEYTGLKDKNGKEIYEGGLCKSVSVQLPSTVTINAVEWNDHRGSFRLVPRWCNITPWPRPSDLMAVWFCEVIGNIYENPELLDGVRTN